MVKISSICLSNSESIQLQSMHMTLLQRKLKFVASSSSASRDMSTSWGPPNFFLFFCGPPNPEVGQLTKCVSSSATGLERKPNIKNLRNK